MLNMQFDQPVVIDTGEMEWEASPMAGVWRKPLVREAAEHGAYHQPGALRCGVTFFGASASKG